MWRCATARDTLLDPCFGDPSNPSAPYVLCVDDRRKPKRLVRLDLTEPLPEAPADLVEEDGDEYTGALTVGRPCAARSGATTSVAGKPLTFACERGDLFGHLDTQLPVWTVPYRATDAADLVTVDVAAVHQ